MQDAYISSLGPLGRQTADIALETSDGVTLPAHLCVLGRIIEGENHPVQKLLDDAQRNSASGRLTEAQYAELSTGLSVKSKRHSTAVVSCFLAELYAQFSGGKDAPAAAAAAAAAWDVLDDKQRGQAVQLADALSAALVLQHWDSRLARRLRTVSPLRFGRCLQAVDRNSQQLPRAYAEGMSRAQSLLEEGAGGVAAAVGRLQPASIARVLESQLKRVAELSEKYRLADKRAKDWQRKAKLSAGERVREAEALAEKAEDEKRAAVERADRAEAGWRAAVARAASMVPIVARAALSERAEGQVQQPGLARADSTDTEDSDNVPLAARAALKRPRT